MSTPSIRTEVLNPCPTCGKRFDIGGCMTFVDHFLTELYSGKCPSCGTQVVQQVEGSQQPQVWDEAKALVDIRAIRIDALVLSVRTKRSLDQAGIVHVGKLLACSEAKLRRTLAVVEPVLREIKELLAKKNLSLAKE